MWADEGDRSNRERFPTNRSRVFWRMSICLAVMGHLLPSLSISPCLPVAIAGLVIPPTLPLASVGSSIPNVFTFARAVRYPLMLIGCPPGPFTFRLGSAHPVELPEDCKLQPANYTK
jgi:hypothetical protein